MKRRALGKGLSALLPDPEPSRSKRGDDPAPDLVAVDRLEPNPYQPRSHMSDDRLEELCASIRESGIVQPILVRPTKGGRYQIVAGERRWRAAQRLGLGEVPVSVRDLPEERLLELALVENVQREDLSALEEAQAYQRLQQELGLTQEQVARRVGRDRSTVANTLRLLRLPRPIRELIDEGRLEAGHGRALLAVSDAEDQISLAREAARKGLSVREVERRVALLQVPRRQAKPKKTDANTRAAEEKLRTVLGTRVQITRRGRGGQLKVAFANEGELARLYELLLRTGRGKR